ncbi:MAG TPA: ribonuclease III domain-containing protein [Methanoculleus sp.]|jgi:ribonuclease-3|nr:ribonuclease III [Methanoculleus sp.]MBP8675959.1 ribonuclease III [Methanoculleus sp.]HON39979.1 ribonuclease III domain-containing protein [Methanoculleus sp.]HRD26253.1 ribonuclease III domain-containing protein [Methanoculleus sp.]HRT12155.1 ribonuclease III domain-containing protein [Methanoculleus sp.]
MNQWENSNRNLRAVEERIGYTFRNPSLLERALTRLACTLETGLPPEMHMDALATLGDAVINVAVVEAVVAEGVHDKGAITNRKMNLVNMSRLRALAEEIGLAEHVRWGKGEAAQRVWTSGRVLAECLEALIGAVYLDGGMVPAAEVLRQLGLIKRA